MPVASLTVRLFSWTRVAPSRATAGSVSTPSEASRSSPRSPSAGRLSDVVAVQPVQLLLSNITGFRLTRLRWKCQTRSSRPNSSVWSS